jgi:hypothetical protein
VASATERRIHDLVLRRLGSTVAAFRAEADLSDAADLRELLVGAIRRNGGNVADIGDYDLAVSLPGAAERLAIFVAVR